MITNFDHIHLYTEDLHGTLDFYQNTLGAEPIGGIPNGHDGTNHVILLGGQFMVVSDYPPGLSPSQPPEHGDGALTHGFGVAHLGLNVDKLDPIIDRLQAAGIEVHSDPQGGEPVRYVYFTAPDGVVVELTEYVLPLKMRAALAALNVFNRGVHKARRAIGKALVKSATS